MNRKSKNVITLFMIAVITVILSCLSFFGVGERNLFGIVNIRQGLDLKGGVTILYEADAESPTVEEINSTISLIRGRLDSKGYTEAEVSGYGSNRIRVDIPGVDNAQTVIDELGQTAQLVFVSEEGDILLSGDQVSNAARQSYVDPVTGVPEVVVALKFTPEGSDNFSVATGNNIGKRIIIMLDEEVLSAPVVNEQISNGEAIINGGFTVDEAVKLADLIRAGSLPFNLIVVQMDEIGAKLGTDALYLSVQAGIIGFIIVLLFMLVFYKMWGFAANIALIMFLALELIVLSFFNITLTLPGIAGIVLSIGMAVDANIIIFERIKEELNSGRTIRASLDSGFSRALPAIIDANITTLIAAFVLFWLGTGPIKGFAVTLTIGIIISMFTALFVTRLILKTFAELSILRRKKYSMN